MSIKAWRDEIDALDFELLRLLNRRAVLAAKVGALKRAAGLPLCDPARERDVLARVCGANEGPLDDRAVRRIFRRVIRESLELEVRSADTSHGAAEVSR